MGEIFERVIPATPLDWTGERLTTAMAGQVEIEHLHRYFLARDLCRGLDVLDVAAGEGYGTMLLAQVARSVVGVEISPQAVAHATAAYAGPNIRFVEGDARCLPLGDGTVDVVVSFETIEHFYEHDQFIAEIRRVLRPGGRFIVSSPERDVYSPSGSNANPYHVHELSRAEFSALLEKSFSCVRLLGQRPMLGSALVTDAEAPRSMLAFERRGPQHFESSRGLPRSVYLIAVASDQQVLDVPDSLYIDTAEIGGVLAAAAQLPALNARLNVLEGAHAAARDRVGSLEAELATARIDASAYAAVRDRASRLEEELATARIDAAVAYAAARDRASSLEAELATARMDVQTARTAAESAQAEAVLAATQRDMARVAARRAGAASEGHWRNQVAELQQRIEEMQQRAVELQQRVAELQERALHWQTRYDGLRARLEAILRRFGILQASRLMPVGVRRFTRQRLLGPGRA